jgi:hypothetical protein
MAPGEPVREDAAAHVAAKLALTYAGSGAAYVSAAWATNVSRWSRTARYRTVSVGLRGA